MTRLAIVAFAAGVFWLQWQPELPPWPAAALLLALPLIGLGRRGWRSGDRRWRWAGALTLLASVAVAGAGWAGWRAEQRLAETLPAEWEGRDLLIEGSVTELPKLFGQGSRFVFSVTAVMTDDAQVPRRLLLSWYPPRSRRAPPPDAEAAEDALAPGEPAWAPRPGERWRLTVRLKKPHGFANPGGLDYEAWLLGRALRATGYVRNSPAPRRLTPDAALTVAPFERLRSVLRERLQPATDRLAFGGVLLALAIGDQGAIGAGDWRLFAATGVSHLMSVSGLHVTMLASLAALLVGGLWRLVPALVLRVPAQRIAVLAGAVTAFAYVGISGFGIPAQRTLIMLTVAAVSLWRGGEVSASRVLALALLVVLLLDPWAVLAPGFWLSFAAVAGLLLVASAAARDGADRGRIWPLLRDFGATQWAATLATIPLLLAFFQTVSLVSPLANLIAIPAISLVVTPLAVAAALSGLEVLLLPAHWILEGVIQVLTWLAALPGAVRGQAAPPAWTLALAGLGVGWLLLPAALGGRLAAALLLLPALFPAVSRPAPGEATIALLDVGHGLSVLVRTASHALVFDAGPPYGPDSDAGERVLVPTLRTLGVDRLDRLLLSHGDSDHVGGAESLLAALPVAQVTGNLAADHALRRRLAAGGREVADCLPGEDWRWDGVRFTILSAAPRGRGDNHDSCVLRIESAAGQRLLLTADIEAPDERALLAADPAALRSAVLQVPHQGSRGASTTAFLDAVRPSHALLAAGYRNRFGHPHPEVEARYAAVGATLWRTDRDGRVEVALGDAVRVTSWRRQAPRYWHGR